MEDILPSHWENSNGPRAIMNRVYYKKDVDELLERSLVFGSWGDVWEVQQAIFDRIKIYCQWAKSDKHFDDVGRYKKNVKVIKRLYSFWRCLNQIRIKFIDIEFRTKFVEVENV